MGKRKTQGRRAAKRERKKNDRIDHKSAGQYIPVLADILTTFVLYVVMRLRTGQNSGAMKANQGTYRTAKKHPCAAE